MPHSKKEFEKFGLAILDSGNLAIRLIKILEADRLFFELVPLPCRITRRGCGYCIKFRLEYIDRIILAGKENNLPVRAVYEVRKDSGRDKFALIYKG